MSQNQQTAADLIVSVLGSLGPLSGQDLKARTGLQQAELVEAVKAGIEGKWILRDNNTFDVPPEYYLEERLGQGTASEPTVELEEEFAAPAPTPAAPKAAAPRPAAGKAASPKAQAPKAAAPKKPAAAKTQAADREEGQVTGAKYYSESMDRIELARLDWLIANALAGADLNASQGTDENSGLAEVLERWARRAVRRSKNMHKAQGTVSPFANYK